MGTTWEDIAENAAINEAYDQDIKAHFLEVSKLFHVIYLFVEGDTEEQAFPILFSKAKLSLETIGVLICNYGGAGNLKHSLNLLKNTLSNSRPVIVTIDNDLEGKKEIQKIAKYKYEGLDIFPLPQSKTPIIYKKGEEGGSFEEIFDPEDFIRACFSKAVVGDDLSGKRGDFQKEFKTTKPWFKQFEAFYYRNIKKPAASLKIKIGEAMANICNTLPKDFVNLVSLIQRIRNKYPIQDISKIDFEWPPRWSRGQDVQSL